MRPSAATLAAGTPAITFIGAAAAAVASALPRGGLLIAVLTLPLVIPVLIAGVRGTGIVLGTTIGFDPWPWLKFTAAYDLTFGVGGLALFGRMVTE